MCEHIEELAQNNELSEIREVKAGFQVLVDEACTDVQNWLEQ